MLKKVGFGNINANIKNNKSPFEANINNQDIPEFIDKHFDFDLDKQPDAPAKVKAGVLTSTILGILGGLSILHKRAGLTLNPLKMIKQPLKEWGISKIKYDWKNVIILAASSITGGLIGGAVFDKKENIKAKLRESLIQMLGNILIPLACVAGGSELFDKHLKNKVIDGLNLRGKKLQGAPSVVISAACLVAAIILGNKTTNLINEKIYHLKDNRHVKFADMSGHIDDTCLAMSLANPGSKFSDKISRVIPLALLVCGYSSGIMQEWPEEVKPFKKIDTKLKK